MNAGVSKTPLLVFSLPMRPIRSRSRNSKDMALRD
jgi:hypothetical protein